MKKLARYLSLVLCSLLLISQQVARADVWGYIDERGVAHFSDQKTDDRYELFYKGGESFDTTKTPKGTPEDPAPRQMAVPTVPAKLLTFFDVSPNYKAIKHHIRDS